MIIKGRYEIIDTIGRGGFGKTYLAKDLEKPNQPKCAVKQLSLMFPNPNHLQEAKHRFAKEAEVLHKLGVNDQIPGYIDHFQENEQFYLVQEFIEGEDFKKELEHRKQLNEKEVISFLLDVLTVLSFVHQQNVIHRDIKPSNLVRRKLDRKIMLIDFGAVKEISTLSIDAQGQISTRPVGTPIYMPPEQTEGKLTFSSDIYALGLTAIEALIGEYPSDENLRTGEIIWQKKVKVNPKLATILNKMVRKDFRDRYQSANDVFHDLLPLTRVGKILVEQYKIIDYLGGGISGHTYLAENQRRSYKPLCVIKQLKPKSTDAATLREAERRFLTEVTVLEKLGYHERIPQLLDHFEHSQEFYLVQEFVEGKDLTQEMTSGRRWSELQVKQLLQDVLEILDFIHQQGVIHRDIKPSNLIRKPDGKIILIDFGAVKEIGTLSVDSQGQKVSTQSLGTEGYMPPEQKDGQPKVSSDFYALGLTAIQALTGKPPESFQKHPQTGEVIWQEGAQVSWKLARVLNKMVRYNFKERYQSAANILKVLGKSSDQSTFLPRNIKTWQVLLFLSIAGLILMVMLQIFPEIQPLILYDEATKLYKSEQYQAAIALYDRVIKLKPDSSEAWNARGMAYFNLNDYQKAKTSCEKAIQIDSNDSLAWNCLGITLQTLKEYPQAIKAFEQAIKIDSKSPESWNNKGDALFLSHQYPQALTAYEEAIRIKPDFYFAINNKGRTLNQMGKYEEAIDAFRKTLEINAKYELAQIGIGNAYLGLKRDSEALDAYNKATKLNPKAFEAWLGKGKALMNLRRLAEARQAYKEADNIKPNHPDVNQAMRNLQKYLETQP